MQDKGWTCVSDLLQLVTDKLDFKKKNSNMVST